MEKKLNYSDVLSNALKIGLKNLFPILGALVLWLITIWIPYLNVGTTIAIGTMSTLLSKGEAINPLDIFDQKYRKCMGEYFLALIFVSLIVWTGFIFLIIPGMVMAIAYGYSIYLVVDKGKGVIDALKLSNKITYGHKWTIFLVMLSLVVFFSVILAIVGFLFTNITIFYIAYFLLLLLLLPVIIAADSYMYGILASDIEKES